MERRLFDQWLEKRNGEPAFRDCTPAHGTRSNENRGHRRKYFAAGRCGCRARLEESRSFSSSPATDNRPTTPCWRSCWKNERSATWRWSSGPQPHETGRETGRVNRKSMERRGLEPLTPPPACKAVSGWIKAHHLDDVQRENRASAPWFPAPDDGSCREKRPRTGQTQRPTGDRIRGGPYIDQVGCCWHRDQQCDGSRGGRYPYPSCAGAYAGHPIRSASSRPAYADTADDARSQH
jgi:hypothetical protein